MYSLENKVAFVTGGANGIGAQIVIQFLKEGAKHVAFLDINESLGYEVEKQLRTTYGENKATFYKCDVTNDEVLFAAYDKVIKDFGIIDVVVNNAGIACDDPKVFKKEIEINFTATVSSTLKALDVMRTDKGGKGGTIINISSVLGLRPYPPGLCIYGATKSAVLHFSNALGAERYSSHTNVRVLTICFHATQTEIMTNALGIDEVVNKYIRNLTPTLKNQSTEDAAKGVVECYKMGESGSTWLVMDGKTNDITDNVKKGFDIISTLPS